MVRAPHVPLVAGADVQSQGAGRCRLDSCVVLQARDRVAGCVAKSASGVRTREQAGALAGGENGGREACDREACEREASTRQESRREKADRTTSPSRIDLPFRIGVAPVAQPAEANPLKGFQCRFDSDRGHQLAADLAKTWS